MWMWMWDGRVGRERAIETCGIGLGSVPFLGLANLTPSLRQHVPHLNRDLSLDTLCTSCCSQSPTLYVHAVRWVYDSVSFCSGKKNGAGGHGIPPLCLFAYLIVCPFVTSFGVLKWSVSVANT